MNAGPIIAIFEKRSNEATSPSDIRFGRSFAFTMWFSANTAGEGFAAAFEFFRSAGDGAYVARWLVAASIRQGRKTGGDHFFVEVRA